MKTASWRRGIVGAMLMFSLSACVSVQLERDYPARRYFVLDAAGDSIAPQANNSGVLKLAPVRVSPRYNTKEFVYRIAPQNFETDFYNRFLVAPGSLLSDELRQVLRQASLFRYVVDAASEVEPTHLLEAMVDELYGDFSSDGTGNAVLAMSFALSEDAADNPQVAFQRRYEKAIPLKARSPEALVEGWNRALEEILNALIADLRSAK
jgi:cholesterol transport system auxiliary component